MEKCKFCQAELAEESTVCPSCGKDNAEIAEVTAQEVPAEEAAVTEEAAPGEETTPAEEAEPGQETAPAEEEKPEPKKATPGKIALAVAAVVVLLAALIALIIAGMGGNQDEAPAQTAAAGQETVAATVPADGNPDDETCKGTYTVTDQEAVAARDTVVATIGDDRLTNGQLQVYYWSMVNNYLSSEYGYYMMMYGAIDYTQPLDTQLSYEDPGSTWQQFFLQQALENWRMSLAMAQEAEKAGVTMSADLREYLDHLEENIQTTADSYGMTMEQLLLNNVGPGAGLEEFRHYQEVYGKGSGYYSAEVAKFVPTEEDLEAFFAAHEAEYASSNITKDGKFVDVRHILIGIEGGTTDDQGVTTYSEEEWAACEAEAQAILDQWLSGDKTEDSFAALANEKSEDAGSNTNGGLYQQVYEGQMVPTFNDWCFDESRQYADSGLVKSDYGYHIMFFVGSEPMWKSYAEQDWITDRTNTFTSELLERYPMEVSYEDIVLGYVNMAG